MILPFIVLALQAPAATPAPTPQGAAPADQRPVHIWMDAVSPVSRGRTVRLYVAAAAAGNLVVLHYRTDGKIDVLFPARPTDDPRISPGTYEVRGASNAPVWVVSEPDGSGMILAALSPDPVWFDEFSREADWRPDALHASWDGADAPSALTDVVQRMLGDGAFNYDVLSYTVAPQAIAQADDSTVPGEQPASCVVCPGMEYQYFLNPRIFWNRRPLGQGGGEQMAVAPRPAVATPLVFPLRSVPGVATPRPVVVTPRRRQETIVEPRVEPLVSRRSSGGMTGGSSDARSALAMRYVRRRTATTEAAESPVPPTAVIRRGEGSLVPATAAQSTVARASGAWAARGAPLGRSMPRNTGNRPATARTTPRSGGSPLRSRW